MNNRIKNNNKKLTAYNIFIKDSFNIIYNRPCLNILPINIKNNISKYKNKKACIVVVELAKLWIDPKNYTIIYKYKLFNNQISFFTNNTYNYITLYNNIVVMDINYDFEGILNKKKDKILTKKINIFNIILFSFMPIRNYLCL